MGLGLIINSLFYIGVIIFVIKNLENDYSFVVKINRSNGYYEYILFLVLSILYLFFFFFLLFFGIINFEDNYVYAGGFEEASKLVKFKGNSVFKFNRNFNTFGGTDTFFNNKSNFNSTNLIGLQNNTILNKFNLSPISNKAIDAYQVFSKGISNYFSNIIDDNKNLDKEFLKNIFIVNYPNSVTESFEKYFGISPIFNMCKSNAIGLRDHTLLGYYYEQKQQFSFNVFTKQKRILNCSPSPVLPNLKTNCGHYGTLSILESNWLVSYNRYCSINEFQLIRNSSIILNKKFIDLNYIYSFLNNDIGSFNNYINLYDYAGDPKGLFKVEVINFLKNKINNNFENSLYFNDIDKNIYELKNGILVKRECPLLVNKIK